MSFWNLFCWCNKKDKEVQEEKSGIKVTFNISSGRINNIFTLFFEENLRKCLGFPQSVIIFIKFVFVAQHVCCSFSSRGFVPRKMDESFTEIFYINVAAQVAWCFNILIL